jgi:hypothetical protein
MQHVSHDLGPDATLPIARPPPPPRTLRLLPSPPSLAPALPAPREPEWLSETARHVVGEIRLYVRTAWAFARRPRASAAAWANGELKALNPLAFLLNNLTIIGPWHILWQRVLRTPDVPLWQEALTAAAPFLAVGLTASFLHLFFHLFGSKRRLTSTWAVSIYAGGGLPLICSLVADPLSLRLKQIGDAVNGQGPAALGSHGWTTFFAYTGALWALTGVMHVVQSIALSGLHGMSRRRSFFVLVVAYTVMFGVFFLVIIAGTFAVLFGRRLLH